MKRKLESTALFFRLRTPGLKAAACVSGSLAILSAGPVLAAGGVDCQKEFVGTTGYAESMVSSYSTQYCTINISQTTGSTASMYIFQPGGILNVADLNGPGIHTFAMIGSASPRNDLQVVQPPAPPPGQPTPSPYFAVHSDGLTWNFSKGTYGLQSVQDPSSASCLSPTPSDSTIPVGSQNFDLQSCQSTVMVDLGSSDSRQVAILKRNRNATVEAVINGQLKTCPVQIGNLFDYQSNHTRVPKKTVIVEPGYNACYYPAWKAFKGFKSMTPTQAIAAYVAQNPTDPCLSVEHASPQSFRLPSTPIASGTTPLPGDQDISAHLKSYDQLVQAVNAVANTNTGVSAVQRKDCALLAKKINSDESSAPLVPPSAAPGVVSAPAPVPATAPADVPGQTNSLGRGGSR